MKVSVCMITYNHQDYIVQAIEGVLMQECDFDLELVIANDCSSDNTDSLIQNILKNHPKSPVINYICQANNLGMLPNFIFALGACQGEYIALCEGDDYWTDPFKLQKQIDFMEANPKYSGCFHDTHKIDESISSSVSEPWRSYKNEIFTLEDTITTTSLFHTSSFLFRTDFLELPNWFEIIQSGDMALFSIIASKGPLYRIDSSMSVYRKNIGGVTTDVKWTDYHKNRIILFKYLRSYCEPSIHAKIKNTVKFHQMELRKLREKAIKKRIRHFLKKITAIITYKKST